MKMVHKKMLQNGKLNIIEDLEEQFNENIYLILAERAQEKLLHKTKLMNSLNSSKDHMFCLITLSLRMKR
jgi:hypothetical protein